MGPVPCSVVGLLLTQRQMAGKQIEVLAAIFVAGRRGAGARQLAQRPPPVATAFPSAGDGRLRAGVAVVFRLGGIALVSESGRLPLARRAVYCCDDRLLHRWL
jgi:hypothetical protein